MKIGKKDVMWGYVSLILVQGINIILLPVILKFLNANEIGLWYTFSSIYSLAMLIDFGFQSVISRNISYLWAGSDEIVKSGMSRKINKKINLDYVLNVLSTIKFIYFVMGIIVLTILSTMGTFYMVEISKDELDLKTVLIAWFVYLVTIVLNLIFSYWNSVLKGIGGIRSYNQILIVSKIVQLVFSVILLYFNLGIIALSIAYFLSILVNRTMQAYTFYNFDETTKSLKNKIHTKYNSDLLKILLPNTYKTGILSVSNYLIIGFPSLMCSYFLSLNVAAQFGFFNQLVTLILTFSNSHFNTYLSQLNVLRIKKDYQSLIAQFKVSIKISLLLNLLAFLALLFLGNFFLKIFDADFSLPTSSVMIIIIIYRYLYNNQTIFTAFLSTKNEMPHYIYFIISSIITVVIQITLILVGYKSIYSIILTSLFVQLGFNNWYWIYFVIKDIRSEKNGESFSNE